MGTGWVERRNACRKISEKPPEEGQLLTELGGNCESEEGWLEFGIFKGITERTSYRA